LHVEYEIAPVHVPRGSENLAKPIEVAPEDAVVRARIEHADAVHLPRLLRLGPERRGEEPRTGAGKERATVDHSIT
jgi:hypothetical protein